MTLHRKDYRPLALKVTETRLDFSIHDNSTIVKSTLSFAVGAAGLEQALKADLCLDGDRSMVALRSISMAVTGDTHGNRALSEGSDYVLSDTTLRIFNKVLAGVVVDGDAGTLFSLDIEVETVPEKNTQLAGLYKSGAIYCTQCEAEAFRRITYYIDRPDAMARFRCVRIEADATKYPVLLSNGNKISEGKADNGRHFVVYEDPFPKPSYLFGLVAGDLGSIKDTFRTKSGKVVALEIFSEHENVNELAHSMEALKKSMKWDEDTYNLEYDLEVFNIVAVGSFNAGAMENKSLNIFNTQYVLVNQATATDEDFMNVTRVIGHEYFHNYTGNRVTCRDWFQLTLKEGLTVFRDQSFSGDMYSRTVRRIQDVRSMRSVQFLEDAGGMAHAPRPDSVQIIDNFYTATVYNKGAEVVRIYETLLTPAGFRKGMDLYFERHDGCAVTCDDFRNAMANANGVDLAQMERWYLQAGTPTVTVEATDFNQTTGTFAITLSQHTPPTPGQPEKLPLLIPVSIGLLDAVTGKEVVPTKVCRLQTETETFTFTGVGTSGAPIPSVLRNFSAPVKVELGALRSHLPFLATHDTDVFNRWDAGQSVYRDAIICKLAGTRDGGDEDVTYLQVFEGFLRAEDLDPLVKAYALGLPSQAELVTSMPSVDPVKLHATMEGVRRSVGVRFKAELTRRYNTLTDSMAAMPFSTDAAGIGRRALRNTYLYYMSCAWADKAETVCCAGVVKKHFDNASCMTDKMAALSTLAQMDSNQAMPAMDACLSKFKEAATGDLVVNKWFTVQASATGPGALDAIKRLVQHDEFTLKNPNRARAVLRPFSQNTTAFHQADGGGYQFFAQTIKEIDGFNPQLAARLAGALTSWRRYTGVHGTLMRNELVAMQEGKCSPDLSEIVQKSLAQQA